MIEVEADEVPLGIVTDPRRKRVAFPESIVDEVLKVYGSVAQDGAMAANQLALLLELAVIRQFDELFGRHLPHLGLLQIVAATECDALELGLLDVKLEIGSVLCFFSFVNDHTILRPGTVEAALLATLVELVDLLGTVGIVGTVHFVEKWTIGFCIVAKEAEILFVAAGVGGGLVPTHCGDRVSCGKAAVCVWFVEEVL